MDQLQNHELGAMLIALGTVMISEGVTPDAAFDGFSDDKMVEVMCRNGIEEDVATVLACSNDLDSLLKHLAP